MISVQTRDFCLQEEYEKLICTKITGAIVTFVGRVRDFSTDYKSFYLQHYPGMTESTLHKIEAQANTRWDLINTNIIHRVGDLSIDDQIVFVGVSAAHRKPAFEACEYMIDILKTQAPFWKREGDHWVEAKTSDQESANFWLKKDTEK